MIMACIIINTIFMALVWFDEPDDLSYFIEIANYTFAAIFTLEAIIKIIAMRRHYFNESWNIFDFTIVAITFVFLMLKLCQIDIGIGSTASVLRILRIGRILRLAKQSQQL